MKPDLSIEILQEEAARFAEIETIYDEPSLYGVTDGKAVGTYLEHKFIAFLAVTYNYKQGNSAAGIEPTFRCLESVEIIRNLSQGGDSNGDKPC
jgi:hypothetical protein